MNNKKLIALSIVFLMLFMVSGISAEEDIPFNTGLMNPNPNQGNSSLFRETEKDIEDSSPDRPGIGRVEPEPPLHTTPLPPHIKAPNGSGGYNTFHYHDTSIPEQYREAIKWFNNQSQTGQEPEIEKDMQKRDVELEVGEEKFVHLHGDWELEPEVSVMPIGGFNPSNGIVNFDVNTMMTGGISLPRPPADEIVLPDPPRDGRKNPSRAGMPLTRLSLEGLREGNVELKLFSGADKKVINVTVVESTTAVEDSEENRINLTVEVDEEKNTPIASGKWEIQERFSNIPIIGNNIGRTIGGSVGNFLPSNNIVEVEVSHMNASPSGMWDRGDVMTFIHLEGLKEGEREVVLIEKEKDKKMYVNIEVVKPTPELVEPEPITPPEGGESPEPDYTNSDILREVNLNIGEKYSFDLPTGWRVHSNSKINYIPEMSIMPIEDDRTRVDRDNYVVEIRPRSKYTGSHNHILDKANDRANQTVEYNIKGVQEGTVDIVLSNRENNDEIIYRVNVEGSRSRISIPRFITNDEPDPGPTDPNNRWSSGIGGSSETDDREESNNPVLRLMDRTRDMLPF